MKASFWERIKASFHHPVAGDSTDELKANPLLDLLGPLDAARSKALALDDESAQRDKLQADALEAEQRQAKAYQQEMLQDIVKLHQQLNTGLSQADLTQLSEKLLENIKFFKNRRTDSLADQGLLAILHSIHKEAIEFAWEKLNRALTAAKLEWPAPAGLSSNANAEDIKIKRDLKFNKLHEEIGRYPGPVTADLLLGRVSAWRAVYPERNGPVWTETVFVAVGLALAAQRHAQLLALGEESADSLRASVAERLKQDLKPVQDQLASGVTSLAQARSLSDQAAQLSQQAASEEFWRLVRPRLETSEGAVR